MSETMKRVMDTLAAADLGTIAIEMPLETRTAQQAADEAGCDVDQIAKSYVFAGATSEQLYLFVAAENRQIDLEKASALVNEPIERANSHKVREVTGFGISGIAPVGHLTPIRAFLDKKLYDYGLIYASAGTLRHIFAIDPMELQRISSGQPSKFK